MRTRFPSRRWLTKFDAAFVANGGHNGQATINAVRQAHAIRLYRNGATPRAAGMADCRGVQDPCQAQYG